MPGNIQGVVLLVEDDANIAVMLGDWLEKQHYEVDFAEDGLDALNLAHANVYDAIVMDIALPRLNGVDVCRRLRSEGINAETPVLMVSARDTLEDKLDGLAAGADDYLTKPFYPAELEARIRALVRRRRSEVAPAILEIGGLSLDPQSQRVLRDGEEISLTPTGFRILHMLMRESPRVVTRAQVEHELWGLDTPDSDALRSHLYVLRKMIDRGHDMRLLHTLPNVGYRVLPIQTRELEAARQRRRRARSRNTASPQQATPAAAAGPALLFLTN